MTRNVTLLFSLSRAQRYGIAILGAVIVTAARLALDPFLGYELPTTMFIFAVILAAWYGGLWPGLFVTALSTLLSEYLFIAPRGRLFQYEHPLSQEQIIILGFVGTAFSLLFYRIREGVKAEFEYLENFHLLIEGVRDYAIFRLDPQGRVSSWNSGAERITGYRENEISGRDLSVFFTPEELETGAHLRGLEIATAEGHFEGEGWRLRKDGSRFWANLSNTALRDARGGLRGFAIVARDMTEPKLAEKALRESRRFAHNIIEVSPSVIYVFDVNQRKFVFINRRGADAVGYDLWRISQEAEFVNSLFHPDDRKLLPGRKRQLASLQDGETTSFECRLRQAGGEWRWYHGHEKVFKRNEDGGVREIIGTLTDITERKRAEEMTEFINAMNETLRPLSDPEEIKLAAARMLGEHLGADRCAYAEIMADENFLEITGDYTSGGTPSIVGRFSVYDLGPEVLRLMRTDNLSVINDVEVEVSNDASLHAFRQADIQALVCMPITKRGHFVARMSVQQKTPRRWLPEDVELIKVVANRCWESVARARALRNLRKRDDRYRAFIAQSSEAIWRYEYEKPVPVSLPEDEQIEMFYRFSYLAECNDAMAKVLGYDSADQIIGARLGDLIAQPDQMNIPFFREFKRAGYRLTNYETRGVDRRGNTKYFLNNLTAIVENGAVVRVWGTSQDITRRKQAEEALRVSEEHARRQLAQIEAIYASAPVGLCFVDAEQRFININNLLAEINGIPVEKHIGRTVREVLPNAADTLEPVFRRVIETGEPSMNVEHSVVTDAQPNILRHFIASFYPIKNGGGRVLGVNVVVMEITQRKKIEEELELLLRQEKAARADAEAANRMKDEFLATISHELRTPLTSILGWARMLTQGGLTAPQSRHALEVIAQSAQSQTRLIDDILDTSRIISGRLKLDAQPVEIEHIFHAAVDVVRPSAEAKGIVLSEAVDVPDGVVFGDASRLQQAVWNLLSNAVKFTGKGGRIAARLGRADGQIEITVKDTGIGIDPGFLPHVFEMFRQADASSTREYGGLGIGLAIVRHIVEMHGGVVSASSLGKGQGATFNIRLPLMSTLRQPPPESPRDEAPPPKERKILENGHKLEGVRLLVVDDHMETLEMLKFIFDESGAEVITATSVEEALDALDRFKPDALVSDIAMPDRNGYDLILEIRSREPEQGGKIPAVAVTAYSRAEDRVRTLAAGFQMHIAKPINPDELIAVVASLTGHINFSVADR